MGIAVVYVKREGEVVEAGTSTDGARETQEVVISYGSSQSQCANNHWKRQFKVYSRRCVIANEALLDTWRRVCVWMGWVGGKGGGL